MAKRNMSHKKGLKTSTKNARKLLKKQKYAAMRESTRGSETTTNTTATGRGRSFTGSTRYCRHPNENRRRKRAAELIAERKKRTDGEQIALLDYRLGANVGAKKERARLNLNIERVVRKYL